MVEGTKRGDVITGEVPEVVWGEFSDYKPVTKLVPFALSPASKADHPRPPHSVARGMIGKDAVFLEMRSSGEAITGRIRWARGPESNLQGSIDGAGVMQLKETRQTAAAALRLVTIGGNSLVLGTRATEDGKETAFVAVDGFETVRQCP